MFDLKPLLNFELGDLFLVTLLVISGSTLVSKLSRFLSHKKELVRVEVPTISKLVETQVNAEPETKSTCLDTTLVDLEQASLDDKNSNFLLEDPDAKISTHSLLEDTTVVRFISNRKFVIRSLQLPKLGLSLKECEDKKSVSHDDPSSLRVAVSDGATEGLFSGIWADLLVKTYVENGASFLSASNLKPIYQQFIQKALQVIAKMPEVRHWSMYEKLDRGTHATLAAIDISCQETAQILTVGDSCVFWRTTHETGMLPELAPEDFGLFPNTICHLPQTWQDLNQRTATKEIQVQDSFQLLLCTDALAYWLVKQLGTQPDDLVWKKLFQIPNSNFFADFIEELRNCKEIRNDDVTLVLIDALPLNDRLS